ncbi:uncharacterized protein BDR25DRAFT_251670 [Lindgomyces ingoldianus]|uniref:Uncharacterized protein n=1 Tax=Lindgomyces ingoldianus TaxID=673940 RepID=A0ACB6RFJ8_9PLEO|nr:uncharacterized protein BDR25DRAFT_251670 [Lindgomyces ingoldianus]KAF2477097.1 hypothetical protein BDR25DRAFT_251670 [Lindgomyces ingoldianus]
MAARRLFTWGGIGALGVGTYYLYNAGGSPTIAEKKFEEDAARASAKFKSELPGRGKEAKKYGELTKEQIEQNYNQAVDSAKATANKVDAKLDAYRQDATRKFEEARKETGKELNSAVDKFDKTVTEKAGQSKSWLGSWFGSK